MAKSKVKIGVADVRTRKEALREAYIKNGLAFKEVDGKKKVMADSDNSLFREYKAELAALRRPDWVE
jgi:hypothetical protein